jgi:hypothetical protein
VGLVWLPLQEGRAATLTPVEVYSDPIVFLGFIGSVPFFLILHNLFTLMNFMASPRTFSSKGSILLKNIQKASIAQILFIMAGLIYIRLFIQGEDPAGPTMLGILSIVIFGTLAFLSTYFLKRSWKKIIK